MKRRAILLIIAVYVVAHLASWCAGKAATTFVHDLAFAYPAILVGLLIGSVGVYLASLGTTVASIRRVADRERAPRVVHHIKSATGELRENVVFAVYLVGLQSVVELVRILDIPGVVWPFGNPVLSKSVFLNAIGMAAAALELILVIDCVRAMFSLNDLNDQANDGA